MPIPTSIRAALAAAVPAMSAPTYQLAYSELDQADDDLVEDVAQVKMDSQAWNPSTAIAQVVGKITQATILTLKVKVPKGTGDIDPEMEKADSDFKLLFHKLENEAVYPARPPLKEAGVYKVDYQGSTMEYTMIESHPGEISIRFALTWRQSRENPEST